VVTGPVDGNGTTPRVGEAPIGEIDTAPPQAVAPSPLDAEAVFAKLKGDRGQIHKRYSDALKSDPTLRGRVDVTVTIGPGRTVIDVELAGCDDSMDRRIGALARTWRFPKPPDGGSAVASRSPFAQAASPPVNDPG
jgi:hypothetical protein